MYIILKSLLNLVYDDGFRNYKELITITNIESKIFKII